MALEYKIAEQREKQVRALAEEDWQELEADMQKVRDLCKQQEELDVEIHLTIRF